jgi:putative ABC transport system permease protein
VPPDERLVTSVVFQPLSPDADIRYITARMNTIMRELRGVQAGETDDFFVLFLGSFLDTFTSVISAFTGFLGVTAGISLLVGGIGVMNIMLVTVTERTREIGLRKAVGAQRRDIIAQFLIEALVITLLGGLLGISFAFLVAQLISSLSTFDITIQPVSLLLSFGISASFGIFFGIYPAQRAARFNPIDALRYE